MTRITCCLFLLCSVLFTSLSAQDYAPVDAHALTVRASGSLGEVAQALVAPFSTERERARAIFTWVAHHVKYDCREFKRAPQDRKARTKADIVERAFTRGMGVCAGYAGLFEALCEEVGLEAEVVPGYARKSLRSPNPDRLPETHAWNAVKIDGEWQLVDATWGAGYVSGDCDRYTADFYDYYFLTPPTEMIRLHWPADPRWQLLPEPLTAEQYVDQPFFTRLPDGVRVTDISPALGTLPSGQARYDFRIALTKGEKLALRVGGKLYPLERNADGVFTASLTPAQLRGRTVEVLYFRDENSYRPIITYQRG